MHKKLPVKTTALVVVDVQNDFVTGSLAVPNAAKIFDEVNRLTEIFDNDKIPVFYTKDWHQPDHPSFLSEGGIWPPHCVFYTDGANHPLQLRLAKNNRSVCKGVHKEAYSGFDGTSLDGVLKLYDIDTLVICGLATDYCVLHTVKDAVKLGYKVFLALNGIAGVGPETCNAAMIEMQKLGIEYIT